jgi:hypothetical protein
MALEPLQVSASPEPNRELIDFTRRFWIALALTLPVLGLAMGGHVLDLGSLVRSNQSIWIQFVLSTPVVLWAGWPFFARGWTSVLRRSPNMFTLIALGTGAAYGFSVVATLAPTLLPLSLRMGTAVPVYFEAASVITVLVLLGQVLELRAREQTGGAIRALLKLAPENAFAGFIHEDIAALQILDENRARHVMHERREARFAFAQGPQRLEMFYRIPDRAFQQRGIEFVFAKEVRGAERHGFGINVRIFRGQHDDGRFAAARKRLAQQIKAGLGPQIIIQEVHVVTAMLDLFQPRFIAGRPFHHEITTGNFGELMAGEDE